MADDITLGLTLPKISPAGKKAATDIANAAVSFGSDEAEDRYLISELTPDVIRAEADRIAAIPESRRRSTEFFDCLWPCIAILQDSQRLALEYATVADELAISAQQAEVLFRALRSLRPPHRSE